jgi:ribosomal protein S18 acetylase RimI-like enzyme
MVKAEIRPARANDVAAIQEIGHKTWPATYSFAGNDYIAAGLAAYWSREALLRSLDDTAVLVAADGDEIIGVGNIDLRGDIPVIWKLYVLPHLQGSGIGSALLTELVDRAPGGTESVRLEYVDGNDRAAAFYRAKGFTELRREPGEQPGWPETVWVERRVAPGVTPQG